MTLFNQKQKLQHNLKHSQTKENLITLKMKTPLLLTFQLIYTTHKNSLHYKNKLQQFGFSNR